MTDRELLTLRTKALGRVVTELDQARKADRYAVAHQYWKWSVAIEWAQVYARLSGKRFTVRRQGTTLNGRPIWDIRPHHRPGPGPHDVRRPTGKRPQPGPTFPNPHRANGDAQHAHHRGPHQRSARRQGHRPGNAGSARS